MEQGGYLRALVGKYVNFTLVIFRGCNILGDPGADSGGDGKSIRTEK